MCKKKIEKGIIIEFVDNKNGVSIKKCCASCQIHDVLDDEGPRRMCLLKKKPVHKGDCCGAWKLSDYMNNIRLHRNGI